MIARLLERLLGWLDQESGCFELQGPVILRDGSCWLRICPGEPPRWFAHDWEALAYG